MGGADELAGQIKKLNDSLVEQEHNIGENGRAVGNYAEMMQKGFAEMAHAGELISPAVSLLRGMGGEGQKAAAALDALSKVMQLAGKAAKVMQTAQQAQTVATESATVAQNGLNAAMAANPIGLIVAGISTLLPLVQSIISAFGDASKEIDAFNNELERQNQLIEQLQADAQFEAKLAGIMGASAKEQLRIQKDAALKARDIADQKVADLMRIMQEGSRKEKKAAKEAYDEALAQQKAANDRLAQLNQQATIQEVTDRKKAEDEKTKIEQDAIKKRQEARNKAREEEAKAQREYAIQQMEDLRLLAQAESATLEAELQDARDMLKNLDEGEEEEQVPTKEEQALNTFGLDQEGLDYYLELCEQGINKTKALNMALREQWERNAKGIFTIIGNIGNGFSALGDLFGNFAEESEDAANAQKAFSMIGILTNQAVSISEGALAVAKGIESAAGIPFPGNIPAIISVTASIASMLAGVASSIAQSKQLFAQAEQKQQKFAGGGIVGGTSYSGDHVQVRANSGEMWINSDSQKRLFDSLTGNGDGSLGFNYELLAQTLSSMPAPVVDYTELQQFGQKVATYNEIAAI